MVRAVRSKNDLMNRLDDAGNKLVIVDFHATWCGPCKMMEPKLKELELENQSKVVVLKVDIDKCQDLADDYNVKALPTFYFMKHGAKQGKIQGADVEKLKSMTKKLIR